TRMEYIRGRVGTSADINTRVSVLYSVPFHPRLRPAPALRRQRSQVRILSGAPVNCLNALFLNKYWQNCRKRSYDWPHTMCGLFQHILELSETLRGALRQFSAR